MTLGEWIAVMEREHGSCLICLDGMAWTLRPAVEVSRSPWAAWPVENAYGMITEAELHTFEAIPVSEYIASQIGISAAMAGEE